MKFSKSGHSFPNKFMYYDYDVLFVVMLKLFWNDDFVDKFCRGTHYCKTFTFYACLI